MNKASNYRGRERDAVGGRRVGGRTPGSFASVGRALEAAERAAASVGQESLFGEVGAAPDGAQTAADLVYVAARPWSERERLANEKLALGYYFSGHLFSEFEAEARRLAPTRLADVKQARESVRLTGVIVAARVQNTRRGRMGVIVLDDASAQLELMVFAELFDRRRALLKEDTLVFVTGRVRFDEFNQRLSISADDVLDLAEARARAAAHLRIEIEGRADVPRLHDVLAAYRVGTGQAAASNGNGNGNGRVDAGRAGERAGEGAEPRGASAGGCRVVLRYSNAAGSAELPLPDSWRVRPDDALLMDLKAQPRVRAAAFAYG